jgi:hypothetical protein
MTKLDGEPINVLTRRHWWTDDMPQWMNRLAHATALWLSASLCGSLLLAWWKGLGIAGAAEMFARPAAFAAIYYTVGLAICWIRKVPFRPRATHDGA